MAILVTGGGGMTSKAMAIQLKAAGIPFLVGSTRGANASAPGIDAVKFDWTDASTFSLPFQHSFPNGEKITAVYIVPGPLADPGPAINAFVDYAMKEQGVKRFVVCAGGSTKKGDSRIGAVWAHLEDVGAEYLVLRPTWFIDNYLAWFLPPLKNESKIYTCSGDATMAFVSAEDIAALAIKGLTSVKPFNCDFAVHGPELVTHDQLAVAKMMEIGFPAEASKFAAYMEANVWDKEWDDTTAKVTGKKLVTCDEFIEKHKAAWL
ncbi:NAD(P)-binding domain superfamily protein [Pleurotus pulmonarius]